MKSFILILAAILMFSQAHAQGKPFPREKVQPVASKALTTFGQLVTEENYKVMGFETPGEKKEASLGVPIQVFMVQLDQLKEYEPGSDPAALLSDVGSVIYPVMVKDQVRSSIKVEKMEGAWQATTFGESNLTKMLTGARSTAADSAQLPIASFSAVRVPALNLYFIAHRAEGVLMLTPVLDNPSFGFKVGISMPADKVFEAILPAAKAHNGEPG